VLELPHAIVGATIAAKLGNPALALPLSLASHFALDLLPHWNPHLNTEMKTKGKLSNTTNLIITADVIASVIAGTYIAAQFLPDRTMFTYVIFGAFLGVAPDVVEAPHFFLNMKIPLIEHLLKFQKSIQNDAPPFLGLSTQVIVILASLWWLWH
jgi:hypothetical protein